MACSPQASAATLAVNFSGRVADSGVPATDATDVVLVESGASSAGAAGVNGTTEWNDLIAIEGDGGSGGASFPVTGTEGASATVEWLDTGTWSASASGSRTVAAEDPSGDLKDGHIEGNNPAGITVSVSDLNFVGPYDVYVYTGHDATAVRAGSYAINGGTPIAHSGAVFDGTFAEGDDYIVFSGVTGSSFEIVGGGDDNANRSGIHGFEVIGRVPEPATGLLFVLAMVLGHVIRGRNR
jgi:hypothetical protein